MRLLRYWRIGLGAAFALSVSLAYAADPAASPYPECTHKASAADLEGAKGAHKAASQFYDRGDYDKAVRYWTDAYSFDCTAHGVLINIANAYEKKGDKAAAVTALETYLKRAGGDPTIEAKVQNLKQSMAPVPTATAVPTAAPTLVPTAPMATASAAPTAPPPPTGPRPFGYTPLIVAGGGGVLTLIGAILVPVGGSAISAAEKKCPVHNLCKDQATIDKGNSGRTEQGVGAASLGIGIAALGGGLVWEFLFNKPKPLDAPAAPATSGAPGVPAAAPPPKASVHVVPALGPQHAGVSISGSF